MARQKYIGSALDLTGEVLNGLEVLNMVSRNPLRWSTICTLCGSKKIFDHERLMNGAAHCGNDNCYVFHQSGLKPNPPSPKPALEVNLVAETPPSVLDSAPVPAPVEHTSPEYRRYYLACLRWGYDTERIVNWSTWQQVQYDPSYKKVFDRVMADVEKSEREVLGEKL